MPKFGVTPESYKALAEWDVGDPACWEFGTGQNRQRFMIDPYASIEETREELGGRKDQSEFETVSELVDNWAETMARRVVETVPDKYNDHAASHNDPPIAGRDEFLAYLGTLDESKVSLAWVNAHVAWAAEQVQKLHDSSAKKASKQR